MAAQRQEWVTAQEIVSAYLDESEQSIHKEYKCWQLVFRCMNELGLDFFYQIKSQKLPIQANLTVMLPPDYLNYTKIGVFNNRGEIIPLKYNNKLSFFQDLQSTRLQNTQDQSLFNYYCGTSGVFYNYWDGFVLQPIYGAPSGAPFVGSFNIDRSNGVILLDETFCYDYIVIEYVASPMQGQTYYVPIQFYEAVLSYIRWKDIISLPSSRRGNLGDKAQRRHEYYNERRLANARFKPLYLMDAYEWSLESQRLTIKS